MSARSGVLCSVSTRPPWRQPASGLLIPDPLSSWGALLIPLLVGIGLWISGLQVVYGHARSTDGIPVGMHFFMGSVMLLAAAGDIRMLVRGGVFRAKRIVRHLWRMCFGLFIATGSFFLGQQQVFPAWLRKTNVLFVPALLPLVLLIFWLFRVWFTSTYRKKPVVAQSEAS